VKLATWQTRPGADARAGVVSDAGLHPLPPATTVLELVRAGDRARLTATTIAEFPPA